MNNGELTELERIKLENYALRHNILQQQLSTLIAARTEYLREVEAAHPGYVWDETKGLVLRGSMKDEPKNSTDTNH